jgi:hypothetical protein
VRNGVVKHVSKLCHLYPSISFKVMVIGVLLAYLIIIMTLYCPKPGSWVDLVTFDANLHVIGGNLIPEVTPKRLP